MLPRVSGDNTAVISVLCMKISQTKGQNMLEKHTVVFSVELNRLYLAFKTNTEKTLKLGGEKRKET